MSSSTSPHARHLPADQRRAATVESVIALAAEQNPSEITTAAIAQRMGVTQGALFRHFPSKDAILQAVMDWVAERLMARLDAAAATATTPLAAIEALFHANITFVAEHPGVPRMMFGELQRAGASAPKRMAQAMLGRYRERLRHHFTAAKAAGQVPAQLDTEAAITLLIGTVQGLVVQSLLANDVGRIAREAPVVFAIYLRGIRSDA